MAEKSEKSEKEDVPVYGMYFGKEQKLKVLVDGEWRSVMVQTDAYVPVCKGALTSRKASKKAHKSDNPADEEAKDVDDEKKTTETATMEVKQELDKESVKSPEQSLAPTSPADAAAVDLSPSLSAATAESEARVVPPRTDRPKPVPVPPRVLSDTQSKAAAMCKPVGMTPKASPEHAKVSGPKPPAYPPPGRPAMVLAVQREKRIPKPIPQPLQLAKGRKPIPQASKPKPKAMPVQPVKVKEDIVTTRKSSSTTKLVGGTSTPGKRKGLAGPDGSMHVIETWETKTMKRVSKCEGQPEEEPGAWRPWKDPVNLEVYEEVAIEDGDDGYGYDYGNYGAGFGDNESYDYGYGGTSSGSGVNDRH
eukprot:symbB.v1.2.006240.t1/scaffold370.1/size393101/6